MTVELADLIEVAEAAKRICVHRWTLYEAIRLGELECYRVGRARRSIRLSEDQLQAWLDRGKQVTAA